MRDFLFQIILFLAGALAGIAVPLLPKLSQKRISGILAIILIAVAAGWAGYELGASQTAIKPSSTPQNTIESETVTTSSSDSVSTPIRTSALATSTYTPAAPEPTDTQSPTLAPTPTWTPPPPSPSPSPLPSPTEIPDTDSDTVLNVGDTWYADGLELRLIDTAFDQNGGDEGQECYIAIFEMENESSTSIYFEMDRDQFWVTDNTGRSYRMRNNFHDHDYCTFTGYIPPLKVGIEPGADFKYEGLERNFSTQFYIPLSDQSITSLTIHVSQLSRIEHAKWSVPIR